MKRYILQQSEHPGHWVLTDTYNGLVCRFEEGRFNESQQFTFLEDVKGDIMAVPTILREMSDWLAAEHPELVFELPFRKRLGRQLRQARLDRGLSIRGLAELAGLSKNHIVRIEEGEYNYTIDTLKAVADALGLSVTVQ